MSANRKEANRYEVTDYLKKYLVITKYCYEYTYSEDVVLADDKLIFIGGDEVCDVDEVYKIQ